MSDAYALALRDPEFVADLQNKLVRAGYTVDVDGVFGSQTARAVRAFQYDNKLVVDGVVGVKTSEALTIAAHTHGVVTLASPPRRLSEDDIRAAAVKLRVPVAVVKAVNAVESRGSGFVGGKPAILFELHIMWKQLQKHGVSPEPYAEQHPDIVGARWNKRHYIGGVAEHTRLERARAIHNDAALESASWGAFQVMGYHWKALGYESVDDFVRRMHQSEGEHLDAFVRYVIKFKCAEALRHDRELTLKDFAAFARCYNGEGFAANHYHTKMLEAYNRFRAQDD